MSEARPLSKTSKVILGIFILFLAVIAVGTIRMAFYGDEQKEQKEVAQAGQAAEQADKKDLAAEVKEACDKGGAVGKELTKQGLCGKAKEIIQEPVKTVEPGLNETQVRNVVKEEIAKRNLTLTPEQVQTVATAASKLVKPGKDGKTPTKAELQPLASAALATFCANDACRGKDGADAPAVTEAQLTATLTAFCSSRNNCIGDDGSDGTNGADGNGIDKVTKVEGPDGVTITMTFTDGRDAFSFTVLNGKDGKDSTVPGPPGPTCPEGSTLQKQQIVTTEFPTGLWVQLCVLTDQNP